MNKFIKAVSIHRFFFLLVLIIAGGCSQTTSEKEWTILVYMAADNNLNEYALSDIASMKAATFSEQVNVIVQIDHRNDYAINDYTGGERWQILPDSKNLISQMGEIDSGSYEVLADFIKWGFSKYPSDKKALVLWSHGNGWYDLYNKFCPDKTSLSSINIPDGELNQALALANFDIDILIFDACNMQTMEVIAEVSDYARFVIGSQDEIKVSGFPYEEILSKWESYDTTVELAKGISNDFLDSYFPAGSQNPHSSIFTFSCSVVDTYKLPDLLEAIDLFIQENPIDWSILESVREDCLEFNDPKIDIDLYQFFLTLSDYYSEADLNDIFLALENFFIYNRAFYPSDNMLFLEDRSSELGFAAVWFPDRINEFTNLKPIYDQLTFQKYTNWTNLINRYFEIDTVKR